jgi:ribose transport system substrate-binding protein
MKTNRLLISAVSVIAMLVGLSACTSKEEGGATAPKKRTIALIPKGTAHSFWKSVHAGGLKAEKELGVTVIWQGPANEDDKSQQLQLVQNFVSRRVDAMVLAPLDDTALVNPVEMAIARKIPVVIIDSGLKSEKITSFVATDNKEGGRMAARELAKSMGGKGKAILLRYREGSASTADREEGFLEAMKAEFPDIELVSTDQYAGVTRETALQKSQNLLNTYGDAVQGIFCPNESSAYGMMRALMTSGKSGKINFVGFDASDDLLAGLKDGTIKGLIVQDPFKMGYLGVKTAVEALDGKPVEKRIPTAVVCVTLENLNTPEVQKLVAKPAEDAAKPEAGAAKQ